MALYVTLIGKQNFNPIFRYLLFIFWRQCKAFFAIVYSFSLVECLLVFLPLTVFEKLQSFRLELNNPWLYPLLVFFFVFFIKITSESSYKMRTLTIVRGLFWLWQAINFNQIASATWRFQKLVRMMKKKTQRHDFLENIFIVFEQ